MKRLLFYTLALLAPLFAVAQQQQQRPQPQQQDLSKDNMEQILKTMQNQEKATQEKVNAQKPQNVRKTGNQW